MREREKNRQTDRDRETEREQDGVVGNVVEGVYFDGCPAWRESTKRCLKINGEYEEEESRSSLASNYRLKLLASTTKRQRCLHGDRDNCQAQRNRKGRICMRIERRGEFWKRI